jgi:acyl-CoA thioester hydrolase
MGQTRGGMSQSDPQRLRLAHYPYVTSMQTRVADVDWQKHVNSIRMAEIFEDARLRFTSSIGFHVQNSAARRLVVSLHHTYLAEVLYPQSLDVASAFVAVGRTSFTIGQAAFQGTRCVALCDIVIVNADGGGPSPLSEEARHLLGQHGLRKTIPD